jgi:hypothetical protein
VAAQRRRRRDRHSLGIDSIAEFQTLTGTYGAQYAGNGGAIIAVTRSGTNEFHGSVYEFFRNSDLDARGFFDPGFRAPVPQKPVRRHLWRPDQEEQGLLLRTMKEFSRCWIPPI